MSRFFEKNDDDENSNDSLDLDDDLNVFKKDAGNQDLIKVNEDKILFYVDLENETVKLTKEEVEADVEQSVDSSIHPILIN